MSNIKKITYLSVFILIAALLTGCTQIDTQTSLTTILISDAPSDNFSHINVTFSQIKIHKSGNENDSGWTFFDLTTTTVDLIHLHQQNLSEAIGMQNLTVGNYSKLWIVVDGATGVLKDTGEEIIFDVPSGDLKIQQPFEIQPGETTIDVEIDLDKSVLYVPQGNVYKLLPVISKVEVNGEGGDDDEDDEDDEEEEDELEVDAGDEYDGEIGESIQFEGEAEGGVTPYSWNWSFGDGNTSNEQNPSHVYDQAGDYEILLVVTDAENNTASDDATAEIKEITDAEMSFATVLISDAPSDNFSHINVTFSHVKIHKTGDDNDSGWISFDTTNTTVDMIYLHTNNLSEVLGVQNLSVGTYSKLWIVVDGATGILKDTGEEITFDVPSGDLKIQQPFEIQEGNTTIDVELDLDRSVLYVPQGSVYKLLPVISTVEVNGEGGDDDEEDDNETDDDEDEEEPEELNVTADGPSEGIMNETIEFSGEAEGGVQPYNWSWDLGDGTNASTQNVTHIYNQTGNYTVILTVTDDEGTIASDTIIVEIKTEEE